MLAPLHWPALAVAIPFLAAALTAMGGRRTAVIAALVVTPVLLALSLALCVEVAASGPMRHSLGGWGAPLGIDLYVDGLGALLLLLTAVVTGATTFYALVYPELRKEGGASGLSHFWPLWFFLWASMNALFVSADAFNLYITLEILTLAAVALVAFKREVEVYVAAMRYLLAALLGSLTYLLGVALLYGEAGALDLFEIAERIEPGPLVWLAAALMTLGLLLKTALFPFHFWLPPAHANAPSPVSAVLSALVVKASFYLLLRLWTLPFGGALDLGAWHFLGVLGAGAILWGGVQALRAERMKLVVAYSSIGQLGYLFLFFPLAASGALARAWEGALLHLLAHGLAKAAAFLAAGNVLVALGSDRLSELPAIRLHLQVSLFAFALAAVSLMGLPPSGGFVAKWLLLTAALESGQWWIAAVLLGGSALAAGYFFRVLRVCMQSQQRGGPLMRSVPRGLEFTALGLAVLAIMLGLLAAWPLALLEASIPTWRGAG